MGQKWQNSGKHIVRLLVLMGRGFNWKLRLVPRALERCSHFSIVRYRFLRQLILTLGFLWKKKTNLHESRKTLIIVFECYDNPYVDHLCNYIKKIILPHEPRHDIHIICIIVQILIYKLTCQSNNTGKNMNLWCRTQVRWIRVIRHNVYDWNIAIIMN